MRIKIFALSFVFLFYPLSVFSEKVGSTFDVEIVESTSTIKPKKITIKNNTMTYYFARLKSLNGEVQSSPVLIDRNEQKIKSNIGDLKLEWEGVVPLIDYTAPTKWLESSKKETHIENPSRLLNTWENSVIDFQGGNINDFIDISLKKDALSAWGLMAINLSVIPQLIADSTISGKIPVTNIENGSFFVSLTKVAQSVKDFNSNIETINYYFTWVEAAIELIDSLKNSFLEEDILVPESIIAVNNYFTYTKTLLKNIESIPGSLKVDSSIKEDLKTEFARQLKNTTGQSLET
ncbi:MAG: hypothetical protein CSB47_11090 [Proteobacteria bacterium]|nr:MAG: hypothetical protein CSB47_11090 [Pseudomonadota bacterium]